MQITCAELCQIFFIILNDSREYANGYVNKITSSIFISGKGNNAGALQH